MATWNFRNGETAINSPYADMEGYQSAYNDVFNHGVSLGSDSQWARQTWASELDKITQQFSSQFQNLVGRAPTSDETNAFLSNSAASIFNGSAGGLGRPGEDTQNVRNQVQQYVADTGQQAAKDYATQQLQGQQAQANSLADLFRSQGNTAINAIEQSLLDYQSKLFDRIRPNLITSLQSQWLLNTGGMNEALAGKQADLARDAGNYMAQLRLQNEQGANQIAFGGAAAPYYYKQGLITQQPDTLATAGMNAMSMNNQGWLSNLDYQHQLGLIGAQTKAQESLQPSFLRTFGQNAATSLGNNFNFPSWFQSGYSGQSPAQNFMKVL